MYKSVDQAKSWPFEEARKILNRIERQGELKKGYVILETGYGPSGLPHIGTFGEVLRTTMVMNAFRMLCPDVPAKIIAFSDDMDGLRKVPSNVPEQELLTQNLEKPLSSVPDPFHKYDSFAAHNNAMLCRFLDSFGFEYEMKSSTAMYKSGAFNEAICRILEHYNEIMDIMIPSLREERQRTYSPFLPVCPRTGKVLQVPISEVNLKERSIIYRDPETGNFEKVSALDGNCKLQWKVDWGMRWFALGVDYEMAGKDLIDSVKLSTQICKEIGGTPPENLIYELFLDEEGKKISKSKGNGLSMEEWLKYAPAESLSYYMYQAPRRAKRLFFDVIPNAMDDYIDSVSKFHKEPDEKKVDSAVFHIHNGNPPHYENCIKFSMLLNLVQACSTSDKNILIGFLKKYADKYHYSEETEKFLEKLSEYAIAYYKDFIEGKRSIKIPQTQQQKEAIAGLIAELSDSLDKTDEELQFLIFEVGKKFFPGDFKKWFETLYGALFGTDNGPKIGSFISLYGIKNTIALLQKSAS
jgi:lysyl-tRNA synthetase class 1